MRLQPLPALNDNYIWILGDPGRGQLVVDPGEAAPVLAALADTPPAAILLTHHHPDHIAGTAQLRERWPGLEVFAPVDERIPGPVHAVGDGDTVRIGEWSFEVLAVPGHTVSHVSYFGHQVLFCGDTLFSLGCGRLFEGTPAQMLHSLDRLKALPGDTRVCCGHEYTLANAAFARVVDPDNPALRRRTEDATTMRQHGQPTLPSRLADECAANPFLRVDAEPVRTAIAARLGGITPDRVETFAELRRWKDGFRA